MTTFFQDQPILELKLAAAQLGLKFSKSCRPKLGFFRIKITPSKQRFLVHPLWTNRQVGCFKPSTKMCSSHICSTPPTISGNLTTDHKAVLNVAGIFTYIYHKNQLFMQVNIPVTWIFRHGGLLPKKVVVQQSGSKSAGNQQLRMCDRAHFGHCSSRWLEKENVQIQPENIEIPEGTGGRTSKLCCECHSIHVWYIYPHLPYFTIKNNDSCR